MKVKTSELTRAALDWAVAQAAKVTPLSHHRSSKHWWSPSTYWAHGGPIIERECIRLAGGGAGSWFASLDRLTPPARSAYGPTPLIAAMRCYVASKLGDEVDIPEELT